MTGTAESRRAGEAYREAFRDVDAALKATGTRGLEKFAALAQGILPLVRWWAQVMRDEGASE